MVFRLIDQMILDLEMDMLSCRPSDNNKVFSEKEMLARQITILEDLRDRLKVKIVC